MLDMPDIIKGLYKRDGVWKCFYVTDADGNVPLLRNSDIVRESLRFTESCCSDNSFRFGGCERSVIEFETVGIGSLLGKDIYCHLDIDCGSLSSADLQQVRDNPGDGALATQFDESWQSRTVYRITLGLFHVVKCTRDHRSQTHRQVTAYSRKYWRLSPIERAKLDWFAGDCTYTADPEKFVLANIGYWSPDFMYSQGWRRDPWIYWDSAEWQSAVKYFQLSFEHSTVGGSYRMSFAVYTKTLKINIANQGLYGIHWGNLDLTGLDDFYRLWFGPEMDWDATDAGFPIAKVECADDMIRYSCFPAYCALTHKDITAPAHQPWTPMQRAYVDRDVPVFSTYSANVKTEVLGQVLSSNDWEISVPYNLAIEVYDSNDNRVDTFSTGISSPDLPIIYKWVDQSPDSRPTSPLVFPLADEYTYHDTWDDTDYTFHRWDVDAEAVIRGWMEVNGSLLVPSRYSPWVKIIQLNQDDPTALGRGDLENAWWDDYSTEEITRVMFNFGPDRDQVGKWGGTGGSSYDMSNNGVLAMAAATSYTAIANMIQSRMRPGLLSLSRYVPAEISMPAWPWLEPGDALELGGDDPHTTYIMTRTMSGVQLLMDEISAPGGDLEDDEK